MADDKQYRLAKNSPVERVVVDKKELFIDDDKPTALSPEQVSRIEATGAKLEQATNNS